jgi:hypothetical protein
MSAVRLIAIDVDGTLLRSDGTVAPADRAAIATALRRGIAVTLATGRLSSSTLPFARALELEVPLVCADGAVLFCPTRAVPLSQTALRAPALGAFLGRLRAHALAPFVFNHHAVCGAQDDLDRFSFVSGWTDNFVAQQALSLSVTATEGDTSIPLIAIGVGPAEVVAAVEGALRADAAIADEVTVFPIRGTDHWVVRLTPSGCSKAVGLALLARQLGISSDEVAAIGDFYNDVSMLEWAGHSFAMGQAPEEVKRAAKHRLAATAETGGAVAEALQRLDQGVSAARS